MQSSSDPLVLPFTVGSASQQNQMADVLAAAFAGMPGAWPDIDAARAEVREFATDPHRVALLAADREPPDSRVLGWIGAIRSSSHGWELHPLAVHPAHQ